MKNLIRLILKIISLFVVAVKPLRVKKFKAPFEGLKFLALVWEDYARAMARRRPDSVLPLLNFVKHGLLHSFVLEFTGATFLVNVAKNGLVVPSHFAPKSLRAGYRALKALKEHTVLFVVPADLMLQLKKAGYIVLPFTVKQEFRGKEVEKYLCFSNFQALLRGAEVLLEGKLEGLNVDSAFNDAFIYPEGREVEEDYLIYDEGEIILKNLVGLVGAGISTKELINSPIFDTILQDFLLQETPDFLDWDEDGWEFWDYDAESTFFAEEAEKVKNILKLFTKEKGFNTINL